MQAFRRIADRQAQDLLHRLKHEAGPNRARHFTTQAARAYELLHRKGYVISCADKWQEMRADHGLTSIYEAILYYDLVLDDRMRQVKTPKTTDRSMSAKNPANARALRQGFRQLAEKLLADYRYKLFMAPPTAEDNRIEVITLFPDFVLSSGETAESVVMARSAERARIAAQSHRNTCTAITGSKKVFVEDLARIRTEILSEPLPGPKFEECEWQSVNQLPLAEGW